MNPFYDPGENIYFVDILSMKSIFISWNSNQLMEKTNKTCANKIT